jgi:hypothetical protein
MLLNDMRVDPADKSNSAFVKACKNGRIEVVKLLLTDKRIDPTIPNFDGMSNRFLNLRRQGIKMAQKNGHKEVVELLMQDSRFSNYKLPADI